jgi:hypothetical protein
VRGMRGLVRACAKGERLSVPSCVLLLAARGAASANMVGRGTQLVQAARPHLNWTLEEPTRSSAPRRAQLHLCNLKLWMPAV